MFLFSSTGTMFARKIQCCQRLSISLAPFKVSQTQSALKSTKKRLIVDEQKLENQSLHVRPVRSKENEMFATFSEQQLEQRLKEVASNMNVIVDMHLNSGLHSGRMDTSNVSPSNRNQRAQSSEVSMCHHHESAPFEMPAQRIAEPRKK